MYHFIALLWNAEDSSARAAAMQLREKLYRSERPWESPLSADGMNVFVLPPSDPALRSYVLTGETGVVLGRLFRTDLSNLHLPPGGQVDEVASRQIVRTAGQHLTHAVWGGYVAFVRAHGGRSAYVIRDCSGKIPCYYTQFGDITLVFADVADLAPLELPAFTVNWDYLAAFLYSSQLQVRACALKEVKEVLAGDRLEVRVSAVSQTVIWDPRSICRQRWILRYEDAVEELRKIVQGCIDAWANTYDPILHSLSGGFDSAVVLGCLRKSPSAPNIMCLNYFAAAVHDDERSYARLAARQAGVRLVELPMESAGDRFDSRLLSGPRTTKPAVTDLFRALEIEMVNRVAAETGARTLWTGQGGDHLFLQTADFSSAGDYLATCGLRLGFIAAVRDAAHLSRQPYWFVLKSALKSGRFSQPRSQTLVRKPWLIDPAVLPENRDAYVAHPWTADAADLPLGKQMQIRLLGEVTNRHRPIPGFEQAPQHHPLLSQPLMEVCLQIPTYLLIRGGRERALAREAFTDRLPAEIIRRRDKGSIISHAMQMLRQGEDFVRELLLEGVLANAGVIVRSHLEPYLVKRQPLREDHLLPLLACIAAEVWTRRWTNSAVAVAA
ncbi:MAG: asparagine synthase-related protein [Steroidobacteraceae bacterium]